MIRKQPPQKENVMKRTTGEYSLPVDPLKYPLLYDLLLYQHLSDNRKDKDSIKKLQLILIKSDCSTMIIKNIQKLNIPSLENDLIGKVRGSGTSWSADYLPIPEGKEAHRLGNHSSQQAINHIIAICNNGVS